MCLYADKQHLQEEICKVSPCHHQQIQVSNHFHHSSCVTVRFEAQGISKINPVHFLVQYRSGSVVVDMTLVFQNKSSVPSAKETESTLNTALTTSSTSLNIISGSVSARKYQQGKSFTVHVPPTLMTG